VKYEGFLSSGSKSPKARVYRKVSSGTCSQVRSEILSDATGEKDVIANRIMHNVRANVSQETHVVNVPDVQPVHPLPQCQVAGGSLQLTRCNWNTERCARQLQVGITICPTEIGREVQTASLLNHVRHVKSAFGNLNVRFTKLVKHRFPNANAKFFSLSKTRDTRLCTRDPATLHFSSISTQMQ